MGPIMRPLYDLVVEQIAKDDTVVVGPATAIGARLAQETHGARLATVHLQPLLLRSLYEKPAPTRRLRSSAGDRGGSNGCALG